MCRDSKGSNQQGPWKRLIRIRKQSNAPGVIPAEKEHMKIELSASQIEMLKEFDSLIQKSYNASDKDDKDCRKRLADSMAHKFTVSVYLNNSII